MEETVAAALAIISVELCLRRSERYLSRPSQFRICSAKFFFEWENLAENANGAKAFKRQLPPKCI
ncbi:MAG: hypothetical protein IJ217_05025 [Clostridia bacterium]|nr:hypothetical protein [Clostridia bacterium]